MTIKTKINRNKRKTIKGVIVKISGNKTVKVEYSYKISHPEYKKTIKRKTILHVHDENNISKIGNEVEVMATRPLSKTKHFRLIKVLTNI